MAEARVQHHICNRHFETDSNNILLMHNIRTDLIEAEQALEALVGLVGWRESLGWMESSN